jgi:hypothetical protein
MCRRCVSRGGGGGGDCSSGQSPDGRLWMGDAGTGVVQGQAICRCQRLVM